MADSDKIIELYQSGLSISAISAAGHGSKPTITKILRKAGVSIRKGVPRLDLPADEINHKYHVEHLSTYELARIYDCSDETIRKLISNKRSTAENNKQRGQVVYDQIAASCTDKWKEDAYRKKVKNSTSTPEYKQALAAAARKNNHLGKFATSKEGRKAASSRAKKLWQDEHYREKQAKHNWRLEKATKASVDLLKNNAEAREKWINKLRGISTERRIHQPKVSMQQMQLYYILSRCGIKFFAEGPDTKISDFYIVDCVIPKQGLMDRDYIIEVQGEYWHALNKTQVKDGQKRPYITNNTNYGLLYLDELDFKSYEAIKSKLGSIGLIFNRKSCSVNDLIVKPVKEETARMFFETFHYLSSARKGATSFGAYLGDDLVACISYTRPIRQQISVKYKNDVLELTRLAIAVDIHCENLASWFIAKTIRQVDATTIISYSDTTVGHTGTVYKASNFRFDGEVAPDYFYVSPVGAKYHKKTIWDRSKKFKMSETTYAELHDLTKVETEAKHRWIFTKNK